MGCASFVCAVGREKRRRGSIHHVRLRAAPPWAYTPEVGQARRSDGPGQAVTDRASLLKALGIDFVSYSEQMDTSTPAGKMVFTVLGAVAELERSLIVERVRAGIRNARAKGKTLGRPRVTVDTAKIASLRASGSSWQSITHQLGISAGTAKRAFYSVSKNPSRATSVCL